MPRTIYIDPLTLPDQAARHIWAENSLSDSQREDIYNLVTKSPDASTLAKHLSMLPLRPEFKGKLLTAKNRMIAPAEPTAPASHVDKIVDAITRLSKLDPDLLKLCEEHPHVLKHMTDAALREDSSETK